eukprot:TRINITY_DN7493_c0_g1_i1.p1 TRINITY_DN7493_c0_g1~~TRINITY_DN7493_c0_g1_i1.p1  ORF type:complete len:353 (+),score=66.47 TRINITY_DN7493_c0_g1_i1:99-1061(+)
MAVHPLPLPLPNAPLRLAERDRTLFETVQAAVQRRGRRALVQDMYRPLHFHMGAQLLDPPLPWHRMLRPGGEAGRNVPRLVEALQDVKIVHVAAGLSHALATSSDGSLYTWGEGNNGKLGHGSRALEWRPRRVECLREEGVHVVEAAGGVDISMARGTCGEVYSWGWGPSGRLGHGGYGDEMTPREVKGLEHVRAVQIGTSSKQSFVVSDEGQLFTFGPVAKAVPKMRFHHCFQASLGGAHLLAMASKKGDKEEPHLVGYGSGERGQLGFNPDTESMEGGVPTEVPFSGPTSEGPPPPPPAHLSFAVRSCRGWSRFSAAP